MHLVATSVVCNGVIRFHCKLFDLISTIYKKKKSLPLPSLCVRHFKLFSLIWVANYVSDYGAEVLVLHHELDTVRQCTMTAFY